MDFFDMNFSTLFLEKHGQLVFDEICNEIKKENSSTDIELVFKISLLDFWGLKCSEIDKMIKDIMRC